MIRKARGEDASRIAEILVFVKRLNYRRIFNDDAVSFGELQVYPLAREYIEQPETLASVWVYDDGFVKAMMRVEDKELVELYVDSFFQSEGIGAQLVDFACRVLDCNRLWVLEKNTRGIAFYQRQGFSLTGERRAEEGTPEYIVQMSLPE